jgi:CelD/BcsL family acetyltransferase involved in cellulose biosynthesis
MTLQETSLAQSRGSDASAAGSPLAAMNGGQERRLVENAVTGVIEIDPRTDSRWGAFVDSHPDGLIYQHPLWVQVIERAYGHRPLCLACEGADGALHGVLPLFRSRGLLTGHRLSSLPHTPVAGPLARDDAAAAALVRGAMERIDREPGSWLQLKLPSAWPAGAAKGLVGVPGQMTYSLEMPGQVEALRFGNSRNHARVQWSVRKASKQGLEVRHAETLADLQAWYRLYLDAMRRHVVPPRPFRFFEAVWDLLRPAGHMRLLLAEQRAAGSAHLVAGSILLMCGRTVFYAFNGWRRQDLTQRANDAIQWQAIHDACREGYRRYDFGEVDEDNQGLAQFKIKWGGRGSRVYRYYYPGPNRLERQALALNRNGHTGARFVQTAWRRLPLWATSMLGDCFYRGV